MELVVRYEDPLFLAVEKPAGMHSAPLRAGEGGTLLDEVILRFPEVAGLPGIKAVEPGLLHRLDRETSGLLVVARSAEGFERLRASFEAGLVDKGYVAICRTAESDPRGGCPSPSSPFSSGVIRVRIESRFAPFGPGRRRVRVVGPEILSFGRGANPGQAGQASRGQSLPGLAPAESESRGRSGRGREPPETTQRTYRTEVEIAAWQNGCCLVHVRLSSGFRHQVRAHLAALGLPILGDELYGEGASDGAESIPRLASGLDRPAGPLARRLYLHAESLDLPHPSTGAPVRIRSPLPPEFGRLFVRGG